MSQAVCRREREAEPEHRTETWTLEVVSGPQPLLTMVLGVHWLEVPVSCRRDSQGFLLCAGTTFLPIKNCEPEVCTEKYGLFLNCRI